MSEDFNKDLGSNIINTIDLSANSYTDWVNEKQMLENAPGFGKFLFALPGGTTSGIAAIYDYKVQGIGGDVVVGKTIVSGGITATCIVTPNSAFQLWLNKVFR